MFGNSHSAGFLLRGCSALPCMDRPMGSSSATSYIFHSYTTTPTAVSLLVMALLLSQMANSRYASLCCVCCHQCSISLGPPWCVKAPEGIPLPQNGQAHALDNHVTPMNYRKTHYLFKNKVSSSQRSIGFLVKLLDPITNASSYRKLVTGGRRNKINVGKKSSPLYT